VAGTLHPSDQQLIDMDVAPDGLSGRFAFASGLGRHDGGLYGGSGLAASVLAMEAATGRDVLWLATQFVSSPRLGDEIAWTAEVLAHGKRASQVTVRATSGGLVAFSAIGSTGIGKDDGLTGQWCEMPKVSSPDDSQAQTGIAAMHHPDSYTVKLELREAEIVEPGPDAALWVRMRDGLPTTPAVIAFAADFVPLAVAKAAGKVGAGSSLDNSMRFRGGVGTEWLLLDLSGDLAAGGFGHGTVRVWGQDGALLATGSQTAAMKYLWDEGEEPRLSG
jgi:acyl-CoA thioesterase